MDQELHLGPPRVFVPVISVKRYGGPIGYEERPADDVGECPIEPEAVEAAGEGGG